ncbi:MAG TPA: glycosyltransferase [Thermoanaerobaculia bacterium]|nr:glycosyltransferase [Thermoanaerobaculia bacterium]
MNSLLYVVPDARFFVTHRLPLALAAPDAGYHVHVATPDGAEVERIRAMGLQWHRIRFGPMRRKPWSDLQSLIDAIRLYRPLRPTLVHHVSFKAILYGTIAARLAHVRHDRANERFERRRRVGNGCRLLDVRHSSTG